MKPPICKVCQSSHWLDEGHNTSALEEVRKLGAGVLGYEKRIATFPDPNPPKSVTTVTKPPNNVTPVTERRVTVRPSRPSHRPGRPRVHKTNAERQRAYRERSR